MTEMINRQRLLESFLAMLAINATSRQESAMAQHVTSILHELNAEIVTDNAAALLGGDSSNIIARVPGTVDVPPVLFCAHIDTVEATDRLQVVRRDGVIRSDGATILGADDKAGVAAIVEMARSIIECGAPRPPMELVFTVAEEIGVMGSMVLDYSLLTARYGFVPDSSGPIGQIITQAPAQKHLDITITGKSAHAGMSPESGISAISVAAQAICAMRQGRVDEETTANIGAIHGGTATNIIPESVTMIAEARSRDPRKLDEQVAHMRDCVLHAAETAGAQAEIDVSDMYPAFHLTADSPAVAIAAQALAPLGIPPVIAATGGGSDANFFNGHGIDTVILSSGYLHPHGHDEEIEESQLTSLAEWLYHIVVLAARG